MWAGRGKHEDGIAETGEADDARLLDSGRQHVILARGHLCGGIGIEKVVIHNQPRSGREWLGQGLAKVSPGWTVGLAANQFCFGGEPHGLPAGEMAV
jgi:hypothetical protein